MGKEISLEVVGFGLLGDMGATRSIWRARETSRDEAGSRGQKRRMYSSSAAVTWVRESRRRTPSLVGGRPSSRGQTGSPWVGGNPWRPSGLFRQRTT
jgi:hypothetical protein